MKKLLLSSLFVLAMYNLTLCQDADEISELTQTFLESLSEAQKNEIQYTFENTLRNNWTNLPIGLAKRPGVQYGALSESSMIAFHKILTTLFSSQGYLKTTSIMQMDDILNLWVKTAKERGQMDDETVQKLEDLQWDYKNYYVSIYGKPDPVEPWGLKFEGHHISYNLTIADHYLSVTPLFLGIDPAEVPITQFAGIRVMSKEEDYGIWLINALDEEQKAKATLSQDVPSDILTNPENDQALDTYQGITANEFDENQRDILRILIGEYLHNLEHEKAHEYMSKIEGTGLDNIYFAWIGSYEARKPSYYVINGPDFMIEYDNARGNHIHTIWREKDNDFGENLLRTHYETHKH